MTAVLEVTPPPAESRENLTTYEHFDSTLPRMTTKEINSMALEHGGYATPELNDKLYLHFKGYHRIENLEDYKNLKAIWLDSNGFQKIENLDHLEALRCLYLSRNLFTTIENLDNLKNLVQLDLSENRISLVKGLSMLSNLESLNLAKNSLSSAESISHLVECKSLTTLDLSNNNLRGEDVMKVIFNILTVLNLRMTGNPITSEVSSFRKKVLVALKNLRYLDRPVFDMERTTTEAWASGGREAELKMKEYLKEKQKKEERKGMDNFRSWQKDVRAKSAGDKRQLLNGPTPQQRAEIERRNEMKAKREEAAAKEAFKERDIYRIDFKCDVDSKLMRDAHKPQEAIIEEGSERVSVQEVKEEYTAADSTTGEIKIVSTCNNDIDHLVLNSDSNGILLKTNRSEMDEDSKYVKMETSDSSATSTTSTTITDTALLVCSNQDLGINHDASDISPKIFSKFNSVADKGIKAEGRRRSSINHHLAPPFMTTKDASEIVVDEGTAITIRSNIVLKDSTESRIHWTHEIDQCLLRCVCQNNHDYVKVAQLMAYNFEDLSKYFTVDSCRRRWYLVDSVEKDRAYRDIGPLEKYYSATNKRASFAGKLAPVKMFS